MLAIIRGAEYATSSTPSAVNRRISKRSFRINVDLIERVASTFPGFISAAVHRSTDGTRVFNYLQGESAEHLAAMQRSPEFQGEPA